MATPVTLPALGESVTEGTVTRWLKQVGDSVEVDEPLLEVSTDKVDTEIPSPVAGTLLEIRVEEDETVEVGAELAIVGDATESGGSSDEVDGGDAAESEEPADLGDGDGDGEDGGGGGGDDDDGDGDGGGGEGDGGGEDGGDDGDGDGDGDDDAQNAAGGAEGDTGLAKAAATASPSGEGPGADGSGVPTEEVSSVADTGSSDGDGTEVTLPALGESVTEGTVTRWLKQVGDAVEVDEALLEVSTDKVDTEIPSPVAGTVQAIKVQEDETVEVGAVLAVVATGEGSAGAGDTPDSTDPDTTDSGTTDSDTDGAGPTADDAQAEVPAEQDEPQDQPEPAQHEIAKVSADEATTPPAHSASEQTQGTPSPAPSGPSPSASDSTQDNRPGGRPAGGSGAPAADDGASASYVTPLVRKLAAQHDVDLSGLSGTGVGGRIRKQDVLAAAESAQTAQTSSQERTEQPSSAPSTATPVPDTSGLRGQTVTMSRLRKTIATRMVESLHVSAQLTTVVEVDVTRIARLRTRAKSQFEQREGVKLSFLPFFAKAAVDALKAYPMVNASIDTDAGTVTYHGAEHLGVAVDTERGLLVPVIKDAGDLSIPGLARKIADLARRTRESKIGPDELSGGTFTLTNTGSRGALFDTPIINQPQVAILGTGAVVKRPVVLDDPELGETIGVRQMVYLALTYDHRIVDGADAARFLSAIKARLEEAAFESDLGA